MSQREILICSFSFVCIIYLLLLLLRMLLDAYTVALHEVVTQNIILHGLQVQVPIQFETPSDIILC